MSQGDPLEPAAAPAKPPRARLFVALEPPQSVRDAIVAWQQRDGAYEALRADLLACRVAPGSRLKIQELCLQHAVSLGAIREALSRLTSEGLVVAEPQRGFRVRVERPQERLTNPSLWDGDLSLPLHRHPEHPAQFPTHT